MTYAEDRPITDGWVYHSVEKPYRHNVREPLARPILNVIRPSGKVLTIGLSEAQIHQMIADCVEVLKQMRLSRGAAQPNGSTGAGTSQPRTGGCACGLGMVSSAPGYTGSVITRDI